MGLINVYGIGYAPRNMMMMMMMMMTMMMMMMISDEMICHEI